jgi:hypothetical protein
MRRSVCKNCGRRPAIFKYCQVCSPRASAIYNRQLRREARAAGERYWTLWWQKKYGSEAFEKRREYFRAYMRLYRRSRGAPAPERRVVGALDSRRLSERGHV